ncbi:MAG: non-homologous end-joining DNA ligase [Candidatus Eremiobacteraeota bacterium]|nr:non-homologous end-joining DNA ligase [Candidatus Eremiobacteraeota bacterium]
MIVTVGKRELAVTNLDKVLFPRDGITKGDLIGYYRAVAEWILPYLRGRPLTLERFPDGIDKGGWWEKQIPKGLPEWVRTVTVSAAYGRHSSVEFIVCEDEPTLAYVANLAAITLHVWTSREPKLDVPDFLLIDLDRGEGCTLATLCRVALTFRAAAEEIGLRSLIKTTGGSGLHVVVPLETRYDYDVIKGFSELLARHVNREAPGDTTLERSVGKRPSGTVYLDYVQVGRGKTLVPPFTVRARDGAPVSMPLAWEEIEALRRKRTADPAREWTRWNLETIPALLRKKGDPWEKQWRGQRLEPALAKAQKRWG